jgi:guanine deaminase
VSTDLAGAPAVAAFRGSILHFLDDPGDAPEPAGAFEYFEDGLLVVREGRVAAAGPASALRPALAPGTPVADHSGRLILPGFVDAHVHFPQTEIIGSYGTQLLEWLERYAFPAEARFADATHAREAAGFFVDELLANGTTTALVFATVHPVSVDALFEAVQDRGMRLVAGKLLMDRNCPEELRESAGAGYEASARLIARWHGRDRLEYAVTPRFAATSSDEQLRLAARLLDEHGGVRLQTHAAENRAEDRWVRELFPGARSYLDVYDRFGLVRPGAVYAHCIHIDDADRRRLAARDAAVAFCPTSNLFLGSGLFDLGAAQRAGVRVGVGTDVGGGTSFSMLQTLNEAYKVARLGAATLTPWRAFYLATLGGARALGLEGSIGSFRPGREADFVVLDPEATPLLARRMAGAASPAERLFAWMILGDDRAVAEVYLLGRPARPRRRDGMARASPGPVRSQP